MHLNPVFGCQSHPRLLKYICVNVFTWPTSGYSLESPGKWRANVVNRRQLSFHLGNKFVVLIDRRRERVWVWVRLGTLLQQQQIRSWHSEKKTILSRSRVKASERWGRENGDWCEGEEQQTCERVQKAVRRPTITHIYCGMSLAECVCVYRPVASAAFFHFLPTCAFHNYYAYYLALFHCVRVCFCHLVVSTHSHPRSLHWEKNCHDMIRISR